MALNENALASLEDLKQQCGDIDVTDTSMDSLLEALINVASDAIENYCSREFHKKEHIEMIRKPANPIILKNFPVVEVLEIQDATMDSPIVSPVLDMEADRGMIYALSYYMPVKFKYIAGYEEIPAPLKQACIIYAKQLLNETGQKSNERIGDYQVAYNNQYNFGTTEFALPQVVKSLISQYKGRV